MVVNGKPSSLLSRRLNARRGHLSLAHGAMIRQEIEMPTERGIIVVDITNGEGIRAVNGFQETSKF